MNIPEQYLDATSAFFDSLFEEKIARGQAKDVLPVRTFVDPRIARKHDAEYNNRIIEEAIQANDGYRVTFPRELKLPKGNIPICRPIRGDGRKVIIQGYSGIGFGSRLWCESPHWEFDTSHFIKTEHFPKGTTPVVEIGYEKKRMEPNPDEGFQCGVANVAIVCPLRPQRPVSGIMWESGLQECSTVRYVSVSNYSGYGIGGPTKQHHEHNDNLPANHLPQVNTVSFEHLWIHSPNVKFPNAIGMSVHGLNFEIKNVTVHHWNGRQPVFRQPCMILSSRSCGRLSQAHLEHNPPRGMDSAAPCVLIPNDRTASRLSIDGAYCYLAANLYTDSKSETVRIANPAASVTLQNVNHRTGTVGNLNKATVCVNDVPRRKEAGMQFSRGSGKVLAFYSRQRDERGVYSVVTTDPALE